MKQPLSPKEQSLYEGIISLMREGKNPSTMTVSEIAAAAHIGKGTVYEYFSSRDELIHKALLYSLSQELSSVKSIILAAKSFKEQCEAVFSWLAKKILGGQCTFHLFLYRWDMLLKAQRDGSLFLSDHLRMIWEILDLLLASGQSDGSIAPVSDQEYVRLVFLSAIAGFCYQVATFPDPSKDALRHKIESSYRMLSKALN